MKETSSRFSRLLLITSLSALLLLVAVTALPLLRNYRECNRGALALIIGIEAKDADELERARGIFWRLAAFDPSACSGAVHHLAQIATNLHEPERAIELLRAELSRNPSDKLSRLALGELLTRAGDVESAAILMSGSVPAGALWSRALDACKSDDLKLAEAYRSVASKLNGHGIYQQINLGICYWQHFGPGQAANVYRDAVRLLPDEPRLREELAVALASQDLPTRPELAEAESSLRSALSLKQSPKADYYLILVLLQEGEFEEAARAREVALARLDAVIAKSNQDAWLFYYRGLIREDGARLADFRNATNLDPKVADFWLALARELGPENCTPEAMQAYKRAIALLPSLKFQQREEACVERSRN